MDTWSTGEKLALGIMAVGTAVLVRAAWKLRGVALPPPAAAAIAALPAAATNVAMQQAALALL